MLPLRGVGEAVSSVSLLVLMMDDRPHPLQHYSPERRNLAESHVVSLLSPWKDGRNKLPPLQCQRDRKYSLCQTWILSSVFYKIYHCSRISVLSTMLRIIDTVVKHFTPFTSLTRF